MIEFESGGDTVEMRSDEMEAKNVRGLYTNREKKVAIR